MQCRPKKDNVSECWQYRFGESVPPWASPKVHKAPQGHLVVMCYDEPRAIIDGDWILEMGDGDVAIARQEDFKDLFLVRETPDDAWRTV